MMFETRKILGDESIAISVTCVRVPGHLLALRVGQRPDPRAARRSRTRARCSRRCPGRGRRPGRPATRRPLGAAGHDDVFVGRMRRDPSHERGLQMWVVSDNLRKGAATNAVQLAELLHARGLVGRAPPARLTNVNCGWVGTLGG